MKQFIVTADDLGICEGTNLAIARACREGIVTSASLMANGPAYEHAVEHAVRPLPNLSIGLHLCLTSGRSLVAPERIPALVDGDGYFRHGFASLYYRLLSQRRTVLPQVELEVEAQFRRLQESGIPIAHVNAHRHIHMIPAIFDAAVCGARKCGSRSIRISTEPFPRMAGFGAGRSVETFLRNLPKKLMLDRWGRRNRRRLEDEGLAAPDRAVGILDSGCVNGGVLRRMIRSAREGVTEVIVHPGLSDSEIDSGIARGDRAFLSSPRRIEEFESLIDCNLPSEFELHNVRLVPFPSCASESVAYLGVCT